MLSTDLTTYRRQPDPAVLAGLEERDALALAEAITRTLPAAHAVARRLLGARDVEALLHATYDALWEEPPTDQTLERWVRVRTAELGVAELSERGTGPASPSVSVVVDGLPAARPSPDPAERRLAALDEAGLEALLSAHDLGIPAREQDRADAGTLLAEALVALAEPTAAEQPAAGAAAADGTLADHVLGLADRDQVPELDAAIASDPARSAAAQLLRRGKRRLEGLPPTPDLGARLLAAVLGGAGTPAPRRRATPSAASALDAPTPARPRPAPATTPRRGPAPETTAGGHMVTDSVEPHRGAAEGPDPAVGSDRAATQLSELFSASDDDEVVNGVLQGDGTAAQGDDTHASAPDDIAELGAEHDGDDGRVVAAYTSGEDDDEYAGSPRPARTGSSVVRLLGLVVLVLGGIALGLVLGRFLIELFQ
ncbi:MAG: hypothetical protein H0V93_07445 [Euzebyales bacterium]|nr:hypothetical protein [Euzebyales bacterium]